MGCGVSRSSARCYRVAVKSGAVQHSSSAVPDVRATAADIQNSAEDVRVEAAHAPSGMGLAQAASDQQDAGAADSPRTATATTSCGASSAAHTISDDGSHGSAPAFRQEADQLEISVTVRADAAMELARRGDGVPEVTLEEWTTPTSSDKARCAEDDQSAAASSSGGNQALVDGMFVRASAMSHDRIVRRAVTKPLPRVACSEGLAGSAYKHPCRKLHPVPWAMNASTDGEALSEGDLQADVPPMQATTQKSLKLIRDEPPNEHAHYMLPINEGPAPKKPMSEACEAEHLLQKESTSDEVQRAELGLLALAPPRRPCQPPNWQKSHEGGSPLCQSPRKRRRPVTETHCQPVLSTGHESPRCSGDESGSASGSVSISDSSSASPAARGPRSAPAPAPAAAPAGPPPSPSHPSRSPAPPPPPRPHWHAVREESAPEPAEETIGARLPRLASIPSQPLGASRSAEQLKPSGLSGIPPLPASRTCCAHDLEVSVARSSSSSSLPAFTDMPLPPEGYEGQIVHHRDGRSLLQRLDPGLPSDEMQRAVATILAQRQQQSDGQQASSSASSGAASTPGMRPLRPLPSGCGELSAGEADQKSSSWHGYVESRKAVPLSALPPLSPASVAPIPQQSKAEETKAEMTRKAAAALANSKTAETFGHVSSRHHARNGMLVATTTADASFQYPWQSGSNVYTMPPGIAGAVAPPLPVLPGMPSGNPHTLPWMPSPLSGLPGMPGFPAMLGASTFPAPAFFNQAPQGCLALPMLYSPDARTESEDSQNAVQPSSPLLGPPGPVRFHSPDAAAGRSPDAAAATGKSHDALKGNGRGRWSHSGRWKDMLYDLRGTHGVTPF